MSKVATRFAPSPTGPLHIGGVRTALFNWLFSKNNGGKFYLRIEDTDKERSKEEYKNQIIQSLKWIGIQYDDKEYIQSQKIKKHKEIAEELLKKGFAYKCYCSEEEIKEQKDKCKKQGIPYVYNRKWRDPKNLETPKNTEPVIRFKSKISGNSTIKDLVQGDINTANSIIEDFVILRRDGSPTYQLSVVVDDHLMKITHVIRGDDHKINTFKQKQIYEAMNWNIPKFAHIPLIHSNKGSKLSKRDKASTIEDYIKMGILSDALRNYLLRLGWAHKDKEIFTLNESIELFNLSGINIKKYRDILTFANEPLRPYASDQSLKRITFRIRSLNIVENEYIKRFTQTGCCIYINKLARPKSVTLRRISAAGIQPGHAPKNTTAHITNTTTTSKSIRRSKTINDSE